MTRRPDGTKEYAIVDHLGSTRMVFSGAGLRLSQTDYAPFGKEIWKQGLDDRLGWIGKETDGESDLGDFGVRKYDEDLGRFLSVDPLWEKYLSFTPYQYSANNPLLLTDRSGEWWTGQHNSILNYAFSDMLTERSLDILKEASKHVDKDQKNQFKHSMRNKGQDRIEAQKLTAEFIKSKVDEFVKNPDIDQALFSLGEAMHPIMDASSPAHAGTQEWKGPNDGLVSKDMEEKREVKEAVGEKKDE